MQTRKNDDALRLEDRLQLGERLFEGARDGQCIGTVLAAHGDEHARLAHDAGVPIFRLVAELHAACVATHADCLSLRLNLPGLGAAAVRDQIERQLRALDESPVEPEKAPAPPKGQPMRGSW